MNRRVYDGRGLRAMKSGVGKKRGRCTEVTESAKHTEKRLKSQKLKVKSQRPKTRNSGSGGLAWVLLGSLRCVPHRTRHSGRDDKFGLRGNWCGGKEVTGQGDWEVSSIDEEDWGN